MNCERLSDAAMRSIIGIAMRTVRLSHDERCRRLTEDLARVELELNERAHADGACGDPECCEP